MSRLRLGISTCPNDTFAFHGLLAGRVDPRGLELSIELADVEALNARLAAGELDAAKGSFHAALRMSEELGVLPVGAALGFGNGPLLLARSAGARPGPSSRVVAPGANTTAALLYRLFHPGAAAPRHVVFSEILPALAAGDADFGVCIHEGRFTWAGRGLALVEDLGERWERETGAPLPLGGIFARRTLSLDVLRRLCEAIAASLDYAWAHPEEALVTMRRYAQELDDAVIRAHVELYVNRWTRDLGPEGRAALRELASRAARAGLLEQRSPLHVLGAPRLYHLAPRAAWEARGAAASPWRPPSLDAEGFVHLSFGHQLEGTRARHCSGAGELLLLEVDPEAAGDAVRLEASRGGALFPHLHRELRPGDLVRRWQLDPGTPLPELARDPRADRPSGGPPTDPAD